jgi:hypothetical protein
MLGPQRDPASRRDDSNSDVDVLQSSVSSVKPMPDRRWGGPHKAARSQTTATALRVRTDEFRCFFRSDYPAPNGVTSRRQAA